MRVFQIKLMIKKFSPPHVKKVSQHQQSKHNALPLQSMPVQGVLHQATKQLWLHLANNLSKETHKEGTGGLLMTVNKQSIVLVISAQYLILLLHHKSLGKFKS